MSRVPFFLLFAFYIVVCSSYSLSRRLEATPIAPSRGLILHSSSIDMIPLNTEPPRRVLLLVEPTPFNYISGYANRFKEMLKFLAKAGDIVHIITVDSDPSAPTEFMGFNITNLSGLKFPYYQSVQVSFDLAAKTRDVIREFQPDIMHVSTPGFLVFRAYKCAREFNIPLVLSYHTHLPVYAETYCKIGKMQIPGAVWLAGHLIRKCHSKADLTLVTSSQLKQDLETIGVRRIQVWQKGIDINRFSPSFKSDEMKRLLSDGHPEDPLLIYVGRLGLEKRLTALKRVLEEIPSARLAFIGKGPYEDQLKEHFKGMNVHFAGQYTGDQLSQAYASADVFVMPSDSETLGFVVIEALASGVPAVGVAAGGLVEIINDGKTGFLVSNGDNYVQFVERVKLLVNDVELRKDMGIKAREWACKFGWEAATSTLRNIQYKLAIDISKYARNNERKEVEHLKDIEELFMKTYYGE